MGFDPLTTGVALATYGGISNWLYNRANTAAARAIMRSRKAPRRYVRKTRAPVKRRRVYKSKYTTRTRTRRYSTVRSRRSLAGLNRRITALSKSVKSDQAIHTHRRRDFLQVGCAVDQVVNTGIEGINTTNLELAMANLRYYDPAVPGTLVTANASTGTYTRQIHFKSVTQKLTVRNNYQVPCMVTIYAATPKEDTNISAVSFYSSGVADQTIGPMAVTSPLLYLTDIDLVRDNWNIRRVKQIFLQPGSQTYAFHATSKPFDYDPSNVDSHNLQFQKKYGAFQFIIRVEGPYGHDTAAAEATTLQAQVEMFVDTKFVITYDAGVNLTDFSEDNNASTTFTNGGVVSNKAVADNQGYSVA